MFRWFKVLAKITREDNILERMEKRHAALTQEMQETESKLKEVQDLHRQVENLASGLKKEIEENRASLEEIGTRIETCDKQIQGKLLEIKNAAAKYLDEVNAKVQSYDSNISDITRKLKDLHEVVAEFQR